MVSDPGVCCGFAREECSLLNMFTGPPRNVCQLGAQEPTGTVGAQGGWLPNFLEVYGTGTGKS